MSTHTPNKALLGVVLALVVAAVWISCLADHEIWDLTGIGNTPVAYLDLYGSLANGEIAHVHGDPYATNPLDPYHRPNLYSRWWLLTGDFGLTRADTVWLGPLLWALGLVATAALLRPSTWREVVLAGLFLCSPPLLMAVHRGNNDWFIFLLISAALACLHRHTAPLRLVAVVLIALAGCLKYFPFAALLVIPSFPGRVHRMVAVGLAAAVLALGLPAMVEGLRASRQFLRAPTGLYGFGASTLARDLGLLTPMPWLIGLVLVSVVAALSFCRPVPAGETADGRQQGFIVGAALTCAGFVLGASYAYKLMFSVWMLPWLWSTSTRSARWLSIFLTGALGFEGLTAMGLNAAPSLWGSSAPGLVEGTILVAQALEWGLGICCAIALTDFLRSQSQRAAAAASKPAAASIA